MQHYKPNYVKFGNKGDVVFFLHGYGGNLSSFKRTATSLQKNYRCYAFDLYGFGLTPHPNKKMDIYEYAIQIYLFCISNKINKISIVSHSFGGRIALILSSLFCIEVENMILVDSAGLKPRRNIIYWFRIWKYKFVKKFGCDNIDKYGSDEYRKIKGFKRDSYVAIVNQHLDYLLLRIKSKTLIVWGDKDKSTPMYMYKKMVRTISGAKGYVFKNSGHFSYLENIYKFNMLVKNFFGPEGV